MERYIINKEDLSIFIKKIYEEGSFGYLDLKESVCEKMLNDFLITQDNYAPLNNYPNVCYESNIGGLNEISAANDPIRIEISTIAGQHYEITDSFSNGINDIPLFVNCPALCPSNHIVSQTQENYQENIGSHSFNIRPQDNGVSSAVTEETQVKIRVVNYNFNGNESERL